MEVLHNKRALPCRCCDCKDCGGFQKLLESKGGLTVYRDTNPMVNNDEIDDNSNDIPGEIEIQPVDNIVITIHNTKNKVLKLADFVDEFDLNKVSCPRCRHIMTRARVILETLSVVEKNEVKCVCDSCLKSIRQKSRAPCHYCQRTMKRFESLGLGTSTRKEDILKKQLINILADEKTNIEITGTKRKLQVYSDVDITKAYESRSKYYDPRLDRPRTSLAVDSNICECDKKLACLMQKRIESKKVKMRVKIRDVPMSVRSLQDFYSTDEKVSARTKPILKPAIETYFTPPQVVQPSGRVQKSPYRSGLQSGTVLGVGTTGIRRTRSDESLTTPYLRISDEILLKKFKYFFPRTIKREKPVAKTSAELIKETQARLQAEAKERTRIREELQRTGQENELKKLLDIGDMKMVEEWAKREGINISDIDTKTGKIRRREKKEDKAQEIGAIYQKDKTKQELQRKRQEKELQKLISIGDKKMIEEWAKKQGINILDIDTKTGKVKQREQKGEKIKETSKKIQEELQRKKQDKELKKIFTLGDLESVKKWAKNQGIPMSDIDLKTGKIIPKDKKVEPQKTVTDKLKREKIVKAKEQQVKEYDTEKKKKEKEYEAEKKKKMGWGAKYERAMKKEKGDEKGITEKIKKEKRKKSVSESEELISSEKKKIKIKETEKKDEAKPDRKKVAKTVEKKEKRVSPTGMKGLGNLKGMERKTEIKTEEKGVQTPRSVVSGPDKKSEEYEEPEGRPFISEFEIFEKEEEIQIRKEEIQFGKSEIIKDKKEAKQPTRRASEQTVEQITLVKKVIGEHEKVKKEATKARKTQIAKLTANKNKAEQAAKKLERTASLEYLDLKAIKKEKEEEKQKQLQLKQKPKVDKRERMAEEVTAKNIKMAVSGDDLILQLVKMNRPRKLEEPPPPPPKEPPKIIKKARKVRKVGSDTGQSDIELDAESHLRKRLLKGRKEEMEVVYGQKITLKKDIPPEPEPKIQPALFQSKFNDRVPYVQITDYESEIVQPDQGPFRYALSDRKYIENGWTMLPTEKIVRKMNVYRIRPAHPEFDWFEHNKMRGELQYENGGKLAEVTPNGRGRWYYKNGRMALEYCDSAEMNAQQRFVIYSSGEPDDKGRSQPVTILGMFDYLGNGVIFDHRGKIRLKYNQSEGVILDRELGPVTHWLWHSLNEPPELQQVMIDTQMPYKDPAIYALYDEDDKLPRPEDEEMLAIELNNYLKSTNNKPTAEFKRHQIRMKALKVNEQFSLKVIDQESIYLIFREESTTMKLNLGMILDHKELLDTSTSELNEVSLSFEKRPPVSESVENLQKNLNNVQNIHRTRLKRELKIRPRSPAASVDRMNASVFKPTHPLLTTDPAAALKTKCKTLPTANNLYYNTRLI